MKTDLRIKNFKRIKEEILLTEFTYVNYFVGENGCGKTSVLNGISLLKDGPNARHFFGPESIVEFTYDVRYQKLVWNEVNPNRTEHGGNLNLNIYVLISNQEGEKGANNLSGIGNIDNAIGIGDAASLERLNSFLEENGINKLTAKKYVDQTDPFNQDNGRLIFENEDGAIDPLFLADGLRAKHNLESTLKNWVSNISSHEPIPISLIVIEEPENNLHPNFQKGIPAMLDAIHKSVDPEIAKRTFFFISTHSPFIISASAKYENQKVYPLKDGKPLAVDFTNHSWIESAESNGYSGSECAYVIGKMLGAEISDLGYPENYCILEEYSLQRILDDARDKGIIKNIQFVSSSGVARSLNLTDTIEELENLNTLIKCNPYYWDKYYLIIDNISGIDDTKLKVRVQKIRKSLQNRFIELSLDSLEDFYQNLDSDLGKTAKEAVAKETGKNIGNCKAEFAARISDRVNDRNTFSRLFNGELDFLLRKTI